VKPSKLDESVFWAVFRRQFEAAANHSTRTYREKAAHMLVVLQEQTADHLHSVPSGAAYEDIVRALEGRYGDHQLAAAYRSQLMNRIQLSGKLLRVCRSRRTVALLGSSRVTCGLHPEGGRPCVRRRSETPRTETAPPGRRQFLGETPNEALNLEAARLREVTRVLLGTRPPPTERSRKKRPVCWQCGNAGILRRLSAKAGRRGRPRLVN
jgi:hypothetical protein